MTGENKGIGGTAVTLRLVGIKCTSCAVFSTTNCTVNNKQSFVSHVLSTCFDLYIKQLKSTKLSP
jgi:hypothetical protein